MALETAVLQQDLFSYSGKDLNTFLTGGWSCAFDLEEEERGSFDFLENQPESGHSGNCNFSPSPIVPHLSEWGSNSEIDISAELKMPIEYPQLDPPTTASKTRSAMLAPTRRRRSKTRKNKEDLENQRMTHITVERNRRKQMNEYLAVLRSLMPDSYSQRGDQASIIGGAISFVKELEQRLQFLGAHKEIKEHSNSLPFDQFFNFPQYPKKLSSMLMEDLVTDNISANVVDIEVTSMVDNHASLKIRSKRRPKQLLKMVTGFQILRLTILHINVTTVDQVVLYSLNVKVEDDCKLSSVDELAAAVYEMLGRIQDEDSLN